MKSFEKLSAWVTEENIAISGRVRIVFLKCGTKTCKCHRGKKEDKHGPYNFWDRKVDGKLTSSSISHEDVKILKKWIKNRKRIEELVLQVKNESDRFARKYIQKK